MNKVILIGRLTRTPEVKYKQGSNSANVAKYTLAVTRDYKKEGNEADFIQCSAWGKNAEIAEKYLQRGMKIAVVGRIQTGSYTKNDGTKVYTTEVVVEKHEFVESKKSQSQDQDAPQPQSNAPSFTGGFMDIPDGVESMPFV